MNYSEQVYLDSLKALEILKDVIHITPLDYSRTFSEMTKGKIFLKLENLQKTGSFKIRGAYYKIWSLGDEKFKGVVAASAGNHAQGVALAATLQRTKSTIVMPETAPIAKINATKGYGAEVVLHGKTFDDAMSKAIELSKEKGFNLIHAYDDLKIIAGQGTIAHEILQQSPVIPDIVVIPIGGGGLISGNAIVLKKKLGNKVKIIGVEPSYIAKYSRGIKEGKPVNLKEAPPGLMDGLIVKGSGNYTFEFIKEYVDDIVKVNDSEVARAMFMLLERGKTLAEGAGAASLAAILENKIDVENKNVVALISGGNVDMTRISNILNYELAKSGRIIKLTGIIPDMPGWLDKVLEKFALAKLNVIDIRHDRMTPLIDPGTALVEVIVETPDPSVIDEVINELNSIGLKFSKALP
ncbi:threonine dehydratase, medium form [Caldisphaera lagunensis DSM 15908]|uniref:threonine ammonia-lyase n=1 Tax=Caldisphaera lagunensis (strain DSM 15908 / JCM 11604 / ANMR 0165 / IC-154) TaxID=1056495 RepID=L0A8F8_CALLD|nr:threonine ammonia-lyase [Caldisphaera lagunensis]AFZ70101.1 threonine dehydratase, medium form [Caldisphaera lagunensis DSM 15908]